jgi:hypothetical protein
MRRKMEGLKKWRAGNRREGNMIAGKMKMKVGKKGRREMKMLLLPRSLCRKRQHKSQQLLLWPVGNISQLLLWLLQWLVKNGGKGKQNTLPHQLKEKPIDHYGDDGGAAGKRKVQVRKIGRRDPHEEFGYEGAKKRRAPPVTYAEEEEEEEYTNLLLFKQEYGNIRVMPAHDPQLHNWVKNMKCSIGT